VVHDPRALESAAEKIPELTYSHSIEETLTGADLTMHLTEWTNYRELDPTIIRKLVNIPTIFDGRNVLDATKWQSAGWKLLALGRAL
jgi:UDPglucose 6-dehydrogenase